MGKTHVKQLADKKYMGGFSLGDKSEMIVIIDKVVTEDVINFKKNGDEEISKEVILYVKGQKPMILNSTNQDRIITALGTAYVEDWVGKKITLTTEKVRAFGKTHDALRVKPVAPKKEALTPTHKHWASILEGIKKKSVTVDALEALYTISAAHKKILNEAV